METAGFPPCAAGHMARRSAATLRWEPAASTIATSVARSLTHGSTMISPGSRSSWLMTALTETEWQDVTHALAALAAAR